jgi:hypothetical protein
MKPQIPIAVKSTLLIGYLGFFAIPPLVKISFLYQSIHARSKWLPGLTNTLTISSTMNAIDELCYNKSLIMFNENYAFQETSRSLPTSVSSTMDAIDELYNALGALRSEKKGLDPKY